MDILLRDGETQEYDIVMPLKDFLWADQNLFFQAVIDGRDIDSSAVDPDGIERRSFSARRMNHEDTEFRVNGYYVYDAAMPVYVSLIGIDVWQSYIDKTREFLAKYAPTSTDR